MSMPTRETISMLRIPLLVLLITMLLVAAAVFASVQYRNSQSVVYNSANASLVQARSKLQTTQAEEKNLQIYSNNYRELARRGLFSEQKRLEWFENIKRLSEHHRLVTLDYDLGPQRTLSAATPHAPNIEIISSPLRMKMTALHEEDLFNFINALRKLPQGFYHFDDCEIKRADSQNLSNGVSIRADCNMDWLTFKARKMRGDAS
ncbi:MAG: hypothetical protein WCC58_10875 [Burkholderiales bacterium]